MNAPRFDPLALLASEAEARSTAEKNNSIDMARLPAASSNSLGVPTMRSYHMNARPVSYPISVETQQQQQHATPTGRTDIGKPFHRDAHQPTPSPTAIPGSELRPSSGTSPARAPAPSSKLKPSFALKMHAILSDPSCKSTITWLPSGKAFVILNRDVFVRKCLPKYFREAKFESFSRRLKRWGFQKIYMTGASQSVYSHELFQRGRLDMCKLMNGNGKPCTKYDVEKLEQSKNSTTEQDVVELKKLAEQAQTTDAGKADPKHPVVQVEPAQTRPQSITRPPHYTTAYSLPVDHVVKNPHMPMPAQFMPSYDHQRHQASSSAPVHPIAFQTQRDVMNRMGYDGNLSSCREQDMSRLEEDISQCEEQLLLLHRMRALKERYYALRR